MPVIFSGTLRHLDDGAAPRQHSLGSSESAVAVVRGEVGGLRSRNKENADSHIGVMGASLFSVGTISSSLEVRGAVSVFPLQNILEGT